MSLQEMVYRGSVVSTGAPQFISVPAGFDQFHLRNITTRAAGAGITDAYWTLGDTQAWATTATVAGGVITWNTIAAGGFTYYDSSITQPGPAIALNGAFITGANPAVVSSATTCQVGGIIRLINTAAMLQVAGMDFTVTAVNPGVTMTLGYLNTNGYAACTSGFYRLLPFDSLFYPPNRFITGITLAAQAVVTLSVTHHYIVGNRVKFIVPAAYGMTQINGLVGTITAITLGATNTITVDIDSRAFTAFAFPISATFAAGETPAQIVPVGEIATIVTGAIRDAGTRGVLVGAAIQGTAGDVFEYWASRSAT